MARHGYLREYDGDFGGGKELEGRFMLGERDEERFGSEHGYGGFQGDYRGGGEQGEFGGQGDYARRRTSFTSHPDAHYLSWREQHMRELDRDYEAYRRERQLQFHRDFDAWRHQRHGNPQPLQPGMTQSGLSAEPTGMLELSNEMPSAVPEGPDPMATATLGTTSGGRGRR